jgi:hypothetical protein
MYWRADSEAEGDIVFFRRRGRWRWYDDEPGALQATEFWPSRWRWYGRKALVFLAWTCLLECPIAGIVAGITLTGDTPSASGSAWWGSLLAGLLIAFRVYAGLTNPIQNFVVLVDSKEVGGPDLGRWPWQVRPYSIHLADIDPVRSSKRSRLDRLLGRQHIYSKYGASLFLQRRSFDRDDIRRLLGLLQIRD